MAIAVAYSIYNRKTTKKAETVMDAESNFKGKIIWDWEAQILVNDDYQDIPKNLLNHATIDTIERACREYVQDYGIFELFEKDQLTEELFIDTQQYPDMIINLSMEMDYDALNLSSEENTPIMPPMDFGEMAKWRPLDGTPGLKRNRAEDFEMVECGNCDATFSIDEGLDIGGIDYCEECYDSRMSKEVVEAETFGAEGDCMHCGQPLEEVEIWEDFRCPHCSKSIGDIYQGDVDYKETLDAENYKHECITCGEGMDDLVAKGQTWSCECCGFLVGTQGKHQGCGFNNDGEVMCNLCASGQCDCAQCEDCGASEGGDIEGCDTCGIFQHHRGRWYSLPTYSEKFGAPLGFNEMGPRPFYGNPRKIAIDRWGNRRFIRRRKDGTYMKNVDVGRSIAMDRRRQSQTWAPPGFRDQGDGSPSLLDRFRFRQQ